MLFSLIYYLYNQLKSVLITGISSGIGAHLALFLANSAYAVLGTCRNAKNLDDVLLKHPNIRIFELHLEQADSIIHAYKQIKPCVEENGLYALINNAGFALPGAIEDVDITAIKELFQINVFAAIQLIQLSIPDLKKYGPGSRIINISSVSGLFAAPFLGAYASSKFALEGVSDSLRREMSLHGIKVVLIEPGPIKTNIWKKHLGIQKKYPTSSFSPFLENGDQIIHDMEKGAMTLDKLEQPIIKALESNKPKPRYLIHRNKFLFFLINRIMPVTLIDWIIKKKLKSPKAKLRPI